MGRHATVAGRMAASAAARGRVFTKLAREIMVAARTGSDPNFNSKLRLAVDRARDNNMPKDVIERAIKKGAGELEGMTFEEITYEGYGPGGSAILVEVLTDNRNRTNPELRKIFTKNSGNMGEMGSVAWMFKKKGVLDVELGAVSEDRIMELALDSGAEDVVVEEGFATIYTVAADFAAVRDALVTAGIKFEKAGLELVPDTRISLNGENAQNALELIEKLEEQDDVQAVYHNFDVQE
ncbi:MAG: YebC/PmpR family DNA-binding transcriptional regulator [Betaproteobacteria bacterium]|nr:YebC/PmpR family DNA-binding transcriptional regulator [Betaproteobacteria bacterium]